MQKTIKTFLFFFLVVVAFLAGILFIVPLNIYAVNTPNFSLWREHAPLTSHVYDRYGNEIATLYGEQNRIIIPLEQIPLHVRQAFIAVEDERFYSHIGIDPIAIARSFLTNMKSRQWTEEGGSTITQQLIKNAYLTREKTLDRKLREAWLSILLERKFSKDEILEMYLNTIYFAHGAYGIEAAANLYFDKSADKLSVAEGALLAGIPRLPNYYSPYVNYENARQRQEMILQKMADLKFITDEQMIEIRDQAIVLAERPSRNYPYPYFLDYMLHQELVPALAELPLFEGRGEAYDAVYTGGLRIYTTLDTAVQASAESVLNNESHYDHNIRVDMQKLRELMANRDLEGFPETVLKEGGVLQPQASVVIAEPSSGELLALVGGREYSKDNQHLRYLSPRQPGSAIKPILIYAPAIEEEILLPGSIVDDAPFIRGDWAPENFRRRFLGLVTVRKAVTESLNVPAAKIFAALGPKKGVEYGIKMGLSTLGPDDYHLAAALGGVTLGVTPLDVAQSYAVLANEGVKVGLHTIKRVEDSSGRVIYEHRADPEVVLQPQTAFLVSEMLKDVVIHGTASGIRVDRPLAAKTGTSSENRDAYLVAYTPEVLISFWMGHDMPITGHIKGGSSAAIPLMNALLEEILDKIPASDFPRPDGIVGPVEICGQSGLRPGRYCPKDKIVEEYFPLDKLPQQICNLHIVLNVCRTSGLLPGYSCPSWEIEPWIFLQRPPFVLTDERWRGGGGRGPEDMHKMPPTEYCRVHNWWHYRQWW
ncbi:MAG: PBP1A family penicillin-binding protein [Bacillota bacterium]